MSPHPWTRPLKLVLSTSLLMTLLSAPAIAGQDPPEDGVDSDQRRESWTDRFSIHGHLTLGFADLESDRDRLRTADEIILGLERDGSFPYGNAALNVRFDATPKQALVLQLAVSDLGDSPADDLGGEVELDWLFYQIDVGEWTRLRLGRQPAAAGIYNELRDVGVLLPFFRPAFSFYREGGLFSETVDGVGLNHRFFPGARWNLDLDLYYGDFEVIEQGGGFDEMVTEVDVSDARGIQLWLNTPVSGLRFGLGGIEWDVSEDSAFNTEETTWASWYGSIDGEFEHLVARAEFRRLEVDVMNESSVAPIELGVDIYYWQLGWKPTEKLAVYLQHEVTDIVQEAAFFTGGSTESRDREDDGISVVYAFRPSLVLKAEYHRVDAEVSVGQEIVVGPGGFAVRVLYETVESDYSIVSLSWSF